MNINELEALAKAAKQTPPGKWHWNEKYGELCYKSEADDQTYMMSCPLPLNESNSRFIAAANPETILAMIALLREMEIKLIEREDALYKLIDAADESDDCEYGTLATNFVRDICKLALGVKHEDQ